MWANEGDTAGLIVICDAAREAAQAVLRAQKVSTPHHEMMELWTRVVALSSSIAATRATTVAGLAAKAAALQAFSDADEDALTPPEGVNLCISLVEDGLSILRQMALEGRKEEL